MESKIPKYIALDLETGGLSDDTSLLTAYFAVLDYNFDIINELDLKLIPDNGLYIVSPGGLEVNKINLIELSKDAFSYKEAKTILYNYLKNNYINDLLTPIGQSVMFDINKLQKTLISKGSWDSFISRRPLDTMYIARFLQEIGKISKDINISLKDLVEYFNIEIDGEFHSARVDTLASIKVLQKMILL